MRESGLGFVLDEEFAGLHQSLIADFTTDVLDATGYGR